MSERREKRDRMVFLKQYLEAEDTDDSKRRQVWDSLHMITLGLSAFFGWSGAFAFGMYMKHFDMNCVLHAMLYVYVNDNSTRPHVKDEIFVPDWRYDFNSSTDGIPINFVRWGDNGDCNVAQFVPIVSMIVAIIWMSFFVACVFWAKSINETDAGIKTQNALLPLVLFAMVTCLVLYHAERCYANGMEDFRIVFENNNAVIVKRINIGFDFHVYMTNFGRRGWHLFSYSIVAEASYIFGIICWLLNILFVLLRLYLQVDFRYRLVTIWTIEPKIRRPKAPKIEEKKPDEKKKSFKKRVRFYTPSPADELRDHLWKDDQTLGQWKNIRRF